MYYHMKPFNDSIRTRMSLLQYTISNVLVLKNKRLTSSRATGYGTDYGLTVKNNYETSCQKIKDLAKESPENREEKDRTKKANYHRKRLFAYSFAIMDLETRLYTAFGSSMKSEREAYDKTMKLRSSIGVRMDSISPDRYS